VLTRRQQKILELDQAGTPAPEIAERLRTHRSHVYRTLAKHATAKSARFRRKGAELAPRGTPPMVLEREPTPAPPDTALLVARRSPLYDGDLGRGLAILAVGADLLAEKLRAERDDEPPTEPGP
jgi:hypothetical protein